MVTLISPDTWLSNNYTYWAYSLINFRLKNCLKTGILMQPTFFSLKLTFPRLLFRNVFFYNCILQFFLMSVWGFLLLEYLLNCKSNHPFTILLFVTFKLFLIVLMVLSIRIFVDSCLFTYTYLKYWHLPLLKYLFWQLSN